MDVLRTKAKESGTSIKPTTGVSDEKGNSGVQKIWHVSPHSDTKGGINKGRSYTSKYAPGVYRNTTAER